MQTIANIRVDERLIHGQVAINWTNTLKATRLMVVDDKAAKNEIQKTALKMACPPGVKLSILTVLTAVKNLTAEKYDGERIFMVVKSPQTLLDLWDAGYHMSEVNVGNMSSKVGTVAVKRTVNVTKEDAQAFHTLADRGVAFDARMIPNEDSVDFMRLLEKQGL